MYQDALYNLQKNQISNPIIITPNIVPYTNNYLILLFQPNQNNFNLTNHNLQNKKQSNLQPINHKKTKIAKPIIQKRSNKTKPQPTITMQSIGKRIKSEPTRTGNSSKTDNAGSCKLSFYTSPPTEAIAIDDFEQFAIDRLQVLRRGDVLKTRGVSGDEYKHEMLKTDSKYLPSSNPSKDYISHYILRLAYCRTEDLRRWFLQQECALFQLRFANSDPSQIDEFMEQANLRYTPIPTSEKKRLEAELLAVYRASIYGVAQASVSVAQKVFSKMDFYKVPFLDVLPLVSKRQVYLEGGFAYVPRNQLATLVQGAFRAKLSKDMAVAYKSANLIQADERIGPLVANLGRIAYRLGRAASAADAESVLSTFMK